MTKLFRGAALLALGLLLSSAAASAFHFSVLKSFPEKDQILDASPKRLHVWFSQTPAEGVSQLKLLAADDKEVIVGKTAIDKESKSAYADLPAALAAGAYRLTWRAAGDDGHVMTGEIKFTVAPKAGN